MGKEECGEGEREKEARSKGNQEQKQQSNKISPYTYFRSASLLQKKKKKKKKNRKSASLMAVCQSLVSFKWQSVGLLWNITFGRSSCVLDINQKDTHHRLSSLVSA